MCLFEQEQITGSEVNDKIQMPVIKILISISIIMCIVAWLILIVSFFIGELIWLRCL